MKKHFFAAAGRAAALFITLVLLIGLVPVTDVWAMPATKTKTYNAAVSNYGLDADASVKVTLTGYIGELDGEECGVPYADKIYVLKSGSSVMDMNIPTSSIIIPVSRSCWG